MQNVDPSIYYPYHTQYPGQTYYSTGSRHTKRNRIGATMLGGLLGMTAYFLPVNKDVFVNRAFEETAKEAQDDISQLKKIDLEQRAGHLSRESEAYLARRGIAAGDIVTRLTTEENRITLEDSVRNIKENLANNFKNLKKEARLRNNAESKAINAIRWNSFGWGAGIGAAIGLALSLMYTRD